jgi:hypothetical protein
MNNIEHFERVWPWLAAALEHAGKTHRKEDLRRCIEEGVCQLHPLRNGAMVTTIQVHPSGLKDANWWLAGGNLQEIVEVMPLLEVWLRSEGCTRAVVSGRQGWLKRLPTYHQMGVIMEKDLT